MKKLYNALNKLYGVMMFVSFFGGFVPVVPFIVALIIGGETGEKISLFLYKQYYPWVIALAALAVVVGLLAMYIGKQQGLSVKKISGDSAKK
ncbi:MAG: hypothetical protein IJB75_00190 [Oscillospiraceae bacterium]|nr:hypothetical protein [Oscillospiraceae bacterium]